MSVIKDLQLVGGDLFPSGRGFATVSGAAYLRQRVATALAEPYGSDPYHSGWGSALEGYLGGPQVSGTSALISSEVSRVLAQLVAAQQQMLTATALTGTKSQLAAGDIIASVDGVTASPGARPDDVQVAISLTTHAGQQLQVVRTVGG